MNAKIPNAHRIVKYMVLGLHSDRDMCGVITYYISYHALELGYMYGVNAKYFIDGKSPRRVARFSLSFLPLAKHRARPFQASRCPCNLSRRVVHFHLLQRAVHLRHRPSFASSPLRPRRSQLPGCRRTGWFHASCPCAAANASLALTCWSAFQVSTPSLSLDPDNEGHAHILMSHRNAGP